MQVESGRSLGTLGLSCGLIRAEPKVDLPATKAINIEFRIGLCLISCLGLLRLGRFNYGLLVWFGLRSYSG